MLNLYAIVTESTIDADLPQSPEGSKNTHPAPVHSKEKKPDSTSSEIVLFRGGCIV